MRESKEDTAMIETVRKNFKKFTKKEVKMAKLSREMQAMIGHPPDSVFKQIVSDKNLKNCPVEVNWINVFPRKQSLLLDFLPLEIVTQRRVELDDKCKAIYGPYVQATIDAIVMNDHTFRTLGYIALGPLGNCQGSLKCFDLEVMLVRTYEGADNLLLYNWAVVKGF